MDELVRPMRIGDDADDAISFIQSMPVVHEMLLARHLTSEQRPLTRRANHSDRMKLVKAL